MTIDLCHTAAMLVRGHRFRTEPLVDRQGNESKGEKEKFLVHRNSILSPLDKNPITTSGPTRFSLFISICQWVSFKSTQSLFLPIRVRWWVLSISSQISLLRLAKPLYRPLILLEIYSPPQAKIPMSWNSSFHIHVAFTQRGYRTIRRKSSLSLDPGKWMILLREPLDRVFIKVDTERPILHYYHYYHYH